NPLRVVVTNAQGQAVQDVIFEADGSLTFHVGDQPVLGMGEGGPQMGRDWRNETIEFDRRGRLHEMQPRWQSNAYGSRNPVALLIGTEGWGFFVATPWGQIDLRNERGRFIPWAPPDPPAPDGEGDRRQRNQERSRYLAQIQGRPPIDTIAPGVFDVFIFDAHNPADLMKDVSVISGPAVMPPKWSLGYMQSHRELTDANLDSESLLLHVVDTFRQKHMPLDAVIYLGTGFTPTGWNTRQPSFDFNPKVFQRDPADVLADLHARHVKVIVHMVPWQRDRLPTLQGTIPPRPSEPLDNSHILNYWQQHVGLVKAGIDAWWPDEGDWFNLFERIKRHQLYYQGPLSAQPNERPWSLHRNGHLGIAQWGGWVWSGDTQSAWKTLEGQIAVGVNHSLSLSPYWGSDTGGFYTTSELTGELYARWFQFSSFCPSFRSHGRIWRLRTPWGWGLSDMGDLEGQRDLPSKSELNNPAIEAVCRQYAELRYRLMPYTYTLARQARDTGLPLMRALWLHYPNDEKARSLGSEYLWGRDLLIAPVFTPAARSRDVYLPEGDWYDWWTNEKQTGGRTVTRDVNLSKMPIYVRAGAIIPLDPVRQYTDQPVTDPTTLQIYPGADGDFTLYEDDGQTLDYLQGQATWTHLTWNNTEKRLTIEPDPRMEGRPLSPRTFSVIVLPEGTRKAAEFNGRQTEVSFVAMP
ncbi:MAG: glycoside hydrolase family 31 protein, partial [Sedimentisphaerales bacterium]|nr:glycoside hydrolase family 31 protein [Sedimentisphaerales bacterium]